jgi:predicted DNA-binding transcriptional regulator AlpA
MTDETAAAILDELKAIRQALEVNQQDGLLTAAEVAQKTGVGRGYVYSNADRLGALRLPSKTGQKPRLRFDLAVVTEALADPEPETRTPRTEVPLLPVGGNK